MIRRKRRPGPSAERHHVQIYDVARTVHFERAARSAAAVTILYRHARYDFDSGLASAVGAQRRGMFGVFWFALRTDIHVLEVGEPLVSRDAARALAAVGGCRLRSALRRAPRALVVSYAIENKDPRETARSLPLRSRVKWRVQSRAALALWRVLDRVAFGTASSCRLYERVFRDADRWPDARVILALPAAGVDADVCTSRPHHAVFLGDLSVRKGFPHLVAAWSAVRATVPDATLTVLGKGAEEPKAHALADSDPGVSVVIDPPRSQIFATLESAKVLVLPSQPMPRWREQVGLPIIEGLSRGCLIVTTVETGLAPWLNSHGHFVIDVPADVPGISRAIAKALLSVRSVESILSDLPASDGRAEAERWMIAGGETRT